MNRLHYTFLILLLSLPTLSFSQDYSQCMQAIGTTGKTAKRDGMHFTYTVGEAVTLTLQGGVHTLTQGFHQPDVCVTVSTDDVDLAAWNIEVFPNPATDLLTVKYAADQTRSLRASVYTLLGDVVLTQQPLTQPEGSRLDCSQWAGGLYLLTLTDPESGATATVRVVVSR